MNPAVVFAVAGFGLAVSIRGLPFAACPGKAISKRYSPAIGTGIQGVFDACISDALVFRP